jgi:hypothetical protein
MKSPSNNARLHDGLTAAQVRFPARATEIEKLFDVDESFRGMCDDLAAAEQALRNVDQLPLHIQEARRDEYADLVDDLVAEIHGALGQSKVIPMPRLPKT